MSENEVVTLQKYPFQFSSVHKICIKYRKKTHRNGQNKIFSKLPIQAIFFFSHSIFQVKMMDQPGDIFESAYLAGMQELMEDNPANKKEEVLLEAWGESAPYSTPTTK